MAVKPVFSEVVKAPNRLGTATPVSASLCPAAAGRRRLDANPVVAQADQGAGEGLFQPWPTPCGVFGNGPVQCRQQDFNLAKFRRPLMTEPIDRAQQ